MIDRIIFNGKVYHSPDEMPPDIRAHYERLETFFADENRDNIPDSLQGKGIQGIKEIINFAKDISKSSQAVGFFDPDQITIIKINDTAININGREFRGLEEMPADIREIFERIVAGVEPGEFKIYDEPWRLAKRDTYFEAHDDELAFSQPELKESSSGDRSEISSTKPFLILITAVIIILCVIVLWQLNGDLIWSDLF